MSWKDYRDKLLMDAAKYITENVLVMSTLVATSLMITKFLYPQHYNQVVEMTTAWLAFKKGH